MDKLLVEMHKAFKNRNVKKLRKLNDKFVSLLFKDQSKETLRLAVLSYVLSKIASKPRYLRNKTGIEKIESLILKLPSSLDEIEREIFKLEDKDPRFVFDLFTKGRIKVASILYAKGMSLSRVSKITDVPKGEILNYAGKTRMFERAPFGKSAKERVRELIKFLGG